MLLIAGMMCFMRDLPDVHDPCTYFSVDEFLAKGDSHWNLTSLDGLNNLLWMNPLFYPALPDCGARQNHVNLDLSYSAYQTAVCAAATQSLEFY